MTKGRELKATRKLYVSFALWAVSSVLVERQLCKLDVKGSNPLRSTKVCPRQKRVAQAMKGESPSGDRLHNFIAG